MIDHGSLATSFGQHDTPLSTPWEFAIALVTKSCRSRPDEKSGGSTPDPHIHDSGRKNGWSITMPQSTVTCTLDPRTGDKSPATCVSRLSLLDANTTKSLRSSLPVSTFTFLSLSVVFRLTFFFACHSHLYFRIPTLLLVFSARTHSNPRRTGTTLRSHFGRGVCSPREM